MSGYEVEHNIPKTEADQAPRRRPDMSTFFSTLELAEPDNNRTLPQRTDIVAAVRNLVHAYQVMQGETEGFAGEAIQVNPDNDLLPRLISTLQGIADDPPEKLEGMPDDFFAELERVPKKDLKPDQSCPICSNPFLDDKYPLVVRLPCHGSHLFDLECIQPWLKLNTTCPLDRQNLARKKPVAAPVSNDDDEEGDYDDMYG